MISTIFTVIQLSPLILYHFLIRFKRDPFSPPLLSLTITNLLFVSMTVTLSCPTLCDPMDYTVYGILYTRILGWVAFPFSRGSSQPGNWTQVSHIAGRFVTNWATREARLSVSIDLLILEVSNKLIHTICTMEFSDSKVTWMTSEPQR